MFAIRFRLCLTLPNSESRAPTHPLIPSGAHVAREPTHDLAHTHTLACARLPFFRILSLFLAFIQAHCCGVVFPFNYVVISLCLSSSTCHSFHTLREGIHTLTHPLVFASSLLCCYVFSGRVNAQAHFQAILHIQHSAQDRAGHAIQGIHPLTTLPAMVSRLSSLVFLRSWPMCCVSPVNRAPPSFFLQ